MVGNNIVIDHERTPPVSPLTLPGVPAHHSTPLHMERARENVPDYLIPVSLDTVIHQLQFKITAKTQPHISVCLLWRYYQLTQFLLVISLGLEFAWGLIIVRRLQG